jgi:hypothetical protein
MKTGARDARWILPDCGLLKFMNLPLQGESNRQAAAFLYRLPPNLSYNRDLFNYGENNMDKTLRGGPPQRGLRA